MPATIQSLWVGDSLSALERLSITSFLAHGHAFVLYVYGPVQGVPAGVRLRDAAEILPRERVFFYRDQPSYAGFANYFRYKLLLERGGWWSDLDAVCLQPFPPGDDPVFASEADRDGRAVPSAGFLRGSAGSPVLAALWESCLALDPAAIGWGETGSGLLARTLPRFGLGGAVQPPEVFCPIPYFDWRDALEPNSPRSFPETTRAVHLWNEMWRRAGQDKDARYPPGCLFERWKSRYDPGASPRTPRGLP
jgi:hypothetical protein